jgi:hypothetical protein
VTAVIAPSRAPLTAPFAAPTRAFRTVVTACAIAAPAFLVTVCLPGRAFVLVPLACFAPARLVQPFFVARAGLPLRAGCFFAEGFFRLERTEGALDALPREPAGPLFFFGLRVGMATSSCAGWSAFVTAVFRSPTSSAAPELGMDPAIPRPGRRRIRVFEPGGRPPSSAWTSPSPFVAFFCEPPAASSSPESPAGPDRERASG